MMNFESLHATALGEWPPELCLRVRESEAGHHVDGLAELERSISLRWTDHPHAVLMSTLHWNILRAVHRAFATDDSVDMAGLPSVRARFEEDLKILATSLHVKEADRTTIRSYLAMASNGAGQRMREKETT